MSRRTEIPRVVIVDDDPVILKFVRSHLEASGYKTTAVMSGMEALETIELQMPNLVILDINLPDINGIEICQRLRKWSQVPIIMLSARSGEDDKVKCLESGADDYITKPFGVVELTARIRTVLRRGKYTNPEPQFISFDNKRLTINHANQTVTVQGKAITLTSFEYKLLWELVNNTGVILTHIHLLNRVWGAEYDRESQYLHVFIGRLRRKIEPDPKQPRYLVTVRRVGYKFDAKVDAF